MGSGRGSGEKEDYDWPGLGQARLSRSVGGQFSRTTSSGEGQHELLCLLAYIVAQPLQRKSRHRTPGWQHNVSSQLGL